MRLISCAMSVTVDSDLSSRYSAQCTHTHTHTHTYTLSHSLNEPILLLVRSVSETEIASSFFAMTFQVYMLLSFTLFSLTALLNFFPSRLNSVES
jgi:hypothetical protein